MLRLLGSAAGLTGSLWPSRRARPAARRRRLRRDTRQLAVQQLESRIALAADSGSPSLPPMLVKDINALGLGAYPRDIAVVGATVYFTADDGVSGRTLWKIDTDGINRGAVRVADIGVGADGFSIRDLTAVGSTLFFSANDGISGFELWKTDGTEAGTVRVADIQAGVGSSYPSSLTAVGSTLYFSANDGVSGREVWKTDGTEAGTVRVADIRGGPTGSFPALLTAVGSALYFVAEDGISSRELWKTDGTEEGTVRVADIAAGTYGSYPASLTAVGATLFFSAHYGVSGRELWKTDGTEAGTVRVADIRAGAEGSDPRYLTAVGPALYFRADDGVSGRELWKTDGTETGTVRVADLRSGAEGSLSYGTSFAAVGSTLFFPANDGISGTELWKTDGTEEGTVRVADVWSGAVGSYPLSLIAVGSTLLFSADDGVTGRELWKIDGIEAGAVRVADVRAGADGSRPRYLTAVGSTLFFSASDSVSGDELWTTDGTEAGTITVADINAGSRRSVPAYLTVVGSTLYFNADDGVSGRELWKTDGTEAGTVRVADVWSGAEGSFFYGTSFAALGSTLFFPANDGISGGELWKTDGTEAGTVRVADVLAGAYGSDPRALTVVGSTLYLTANDGVSGRELWKTDGTEEGTARVADISVGFGGSYPSFLTAVGSTLFFSANDGVSGTSLWKTDGTEAGTVQVADVRPAFETSFSRGLVTVVGSTLFFSASDGVSGYELWKTDGTEAGTVRVADINAGSGGSRPSSLTLVGSTLFFSASDGISGYELWKTDGTEAGTVRVADINAGSGGSSPSSLTLVGSTLFFRANDGVSGGELWKTDGTEEGTARVADISVGFGGSYPSFLTAVGSTLFFSADDSVSGGELWKTDGTEEGTVRVADIRGGFNGSSPFSLTAVGSMLYFAADDGISGTELWLLPAAGVDETPPTVAITDDVPGAATGPLTFTFTFSEPVSGFTADAVVVANGTKGAFTAVTATIYTLVITPSADTAGTLTVSLNPGAGIDAAGNESLGTSVTQPFDTTPDAVPPTVVITDDVPGTTSGSVTFTFTFSEPVTGFTADDITVTGGTKGAFTAENQQVYRLVVAPPPGSAGVVTVSLAAGAATDLAGNASLPATASQDYPNTAPVIVSTALPSIVEGLPLVLSVVAEDPNVGQTVTYSVAGGPDAALFTFVGNGLVLQPFRGSSFASPADVGADNVYEVTISVSDGFATVTQDVRVTILAPTGNLAVGEIGETTAAVALAQALVGDGVTISNVQYTGTGRSAGFFSGGLTASLGLPQGIVLSSGLVANAIGPNTEDGTSFTLDTAGQADLDALIPGFTTFDATVLEFDFTVADSALSFQYVFASEEYNEFVNSSYNDVFGFFVDGVNIALLPGTTTPVAINNVNAGLNAVFYRNNDPGDLGQPTPFATAADGFTSVLQASITLQPGTHRIRLAIADAGDRVLDSWVFLSAQSFVSGSGDLQITAGGVPAVVAPGALFTLEYTVTNAGSEAVSGALFQAALPAGLEFVAATTSQGLLAHAGGFLTGTIGDLAGGASASVGVTVRVVGTGELVTNAFAQADQIDPVTANNSVAVATSVNVPPTITSAAAVTIEEGRANVLTVTATDPNPGTTFVFSIVGGADAALFSFEGATLRLLAPAGAVAASPADADGDGIYEVTIRVGDGMAFTEQNVFVTVIADTTPPTVAITDDVPGTATGPVTFTFTFSEPVTGFTADDVAVANGSKGAFTAVTAAVYTLVVTPLAASTTPIAILVPANAAQDLAGNPSTANVTSQPVDTVPPTVTITDDVPGTATGPVTFTFTFSEPVTDFTADDAVVANGAKGAFTAVSDTVYTLVVTPSAAATGPLTVSLAAGAATDAAGNPSGAASTTQEIPVRAVIGAAAPAGVVTEDTGVDATGGLLATGTFTIVDPNPGEAAFKTIVTVPGGVTNLGTLEITAAGAFTYGVQNSLDTVQALRAGETRTEVFTIESLDGTRLDVTFSIAGVADVLAGVVADGYLAGATVFADANGNRVLDPGELFTTTDGAGNFSFDFGSLTATLVTSGGTDISTGLPFAGSLTAPAGSAVINPLTTLVTAVVAAGAPPADSAALAAAVAAASSQVVTGLGLPAVNLTTFDPLAAGADAQTALAVQKAAASVANVIVVAGTVGASPAAAVTNLATAVTTVAAGQTVNLGDAAVLTAVLTTGATPPPAAAVAGVAQANTQIATAATIGAVAELQTVIQSASAFVEENAAIATVVFQAATPAGMTAPAFSLKDVAGDDTSLVSIDAATGSVRLLAPANFEAKASYRFTVVASQEGQTTVETAITVVVADVNEAPTDIGLAAATVAENQPSGTAVGTFSSTDPDAGNTFTYALVAGTGDTDNAAFTIDGTTLKTAAEFNVEAKSSYTVRVKSTDQGGLSTEKVFTITVTDVADEPLLVEGVTPPAPGAYRAGQRVTFAVTLSEAVQVKGKPQIQVRAGTVTRTATYVSGSGTAVLTFQYTVGTKDNAPAVALGQKFVFANTSSIAAGTEKLPVNLPAGIAGATAPGVRLDAAAPKVVGKVVVPGSGTYTVGQSLDFVVRFSEAVIVGGTPQIGLTGLTAARQATYVSGSGTESLTFRYVVQAGDALRGKKTLGLTKSITLPSGGSITDEAGNRAGLSISAPSMKGVRIDTTTVATATLSVGGDMAFTTKRARAAAFATLG